jgi:hypothetical protein
MENELINVDELLVTLKKLEVRISGGSFFFNWVLNRVDPS